MARELQIKITADASQAKRELGTVETGLRGIGDETAKTERSVSETLTKFGAGATQAGAVLGVGLTAPIVLAMKKVLDLGMQTVESENLVKQSFGGMTQAAVEWSKNLSKALGLNEFELRRNSGLLFNMFGSMGVAKEKAFDMATGLTKLSEDMASFFNINPQEAFEKTAVRHRRRDGTAAAARHPR
jgi:hypothetical protein